MPNHLAALLLLASVAVCQDAPQKEGAKGKKGDPTLAARATTAFGLDLFRALAAERADSNLVLSPWSTAIALAMTAEGARAETRAQLQALLHLPTGDLAAAHASFGALIERLEQGGGASDDAAKATLSDLRRRLAKKNREALSAERANKWEDASRASNEASAIAADLNRMLFAMDRYELRTASAVWVDRGHPLSAAYEAALRSHYATGGARALDFAGHFEAARGTINAWVAENTASRIPELLPQGSIRADTRMVLTNAVWFRGAWQVPFETRNTRDEDFVLASGERVRAKTMRDGERIALRYGAFAADGKPFVTPLEVPAEPDATQPACYPGDDGFAMVELPYRGQELSMLVVAPRSHDGLQRLERLLTEERLAQWVASMQEFTVDLAMPRFSMRVQTELSVGLKALGATRAFEAPGPNGVGAQFDGMSEAGGKGDALRIDSVLHEAWIEVGEEGTEAAAATAVMMLPGAAVQEQRMVPFCPVFHADRPFVFAIRDGKTGAILFVGRVVDPRS